MRARPRVRAGLAAALALALSACASTAAIRAGGTVAGDTLVVYSVLPHPDEGAMRDLGDGEKLALVRAGGRAGPFTVTFATGVPTAIGPLSVDERGQPRSAAFAVRAAAGGPARVLRLPAARCG